MPSDVNVSSARGCEWAERDLVPNMANELWSESIEAALEGFGNDWSFNAAQARRYLVKAGEPPCAVEEAHQIVRAVEAHYGVSIRDVASDLDADSEELAYYLVMQTLGHGVAWSDDHDATLWTPRWGAAMWATQDDTERLLLDWLNADADACDLTDEDDDEDDDDDDEA